MDEQKNSGQPQVIGQQWQYQSGQLEQPQAPEPVARTPSADEDGTIRWSASEFVSHEKSPFWYVALVAAAVILAAVMYLATKEIFSIVVVAVLAVALGVFGALKPRTLDYAIDGSGVTVGEKHFPYDTFKSFAIIEDAPIPSIQLLPQKRFMVPITIYFAPTQQDDIIDTLGQFLPFEHKKRDNVDKITSRIHF